MFKVPDGKDPYSEIGKYIRNHITAIEDIIATIEIDGIQINELFLVDMDEDGYFVWKSDWYEGEQNIALIDFFPVSSAKPERENEPVGCNGCRYDSQPELQWVPCSERLPEEDHWLGGSGKQFSDNVLVSIYNSDDEDEWVDVSQTIDGEWRTELPRHCEIVAWMPLLEPYRGEKNEND